MSGAEFHFDETPTAEIERIEALYGGLADILRELADATIRTTVDDEQVRLAKADLESALRRLRQAEVPGPAGVHYNAEGRSWAWGNAVIGPRNPVALPLKVIQEPDGLCWADAILPHSYEGPPGLAHGGIAALLLDHIMGVTASASKRVTFTGTLSLRYRRGTPLGHVRLESRITSEEERKVYVEAAILDADGPTVEATGIFIIPSWAV